MFWGLYWFALTIALLAMVNLESFQEDGVGGCYVDLVDGGTGSGALTGLDVKRRAAELSYD